MKPALSTLQTYVMANRNVAVCDLYTFSLVNGIVLRYCAWPLSGMIIPSANFPGSPLNYAASGNRTFLRGPRFGRTKITVKVGTSGNECDITMLVGPQDGAIGGLTWQQVFAQGQFDGAVIEIDRFFMPVGGDGVAGPLNTSLGAIVWFYGKVGDVDIGSSKILVKALDFMSVLEKSQMPRRVFQNPCNHIFGDNMCLFNRSSMAITVTAQSGSTPSLILASLSASPADLYNQGSIEGLTGANTGQTCSIAVTAVGSSGQIYTYTPFFFTPAIGDTFQLLPGCDHTVNTCKNVFNNLIHYGGMPYIPAPELAL